MNDDDSRSKPTDHRERVLAPDGVLDAVPEDFETQIRATAHSWPPGLTTIGLVALVLLVAGGYGVIQQRSAAQQEIRLLQAALATAASPAEVAAARETQLGMEQEAAKNRATIDVLNLYNKRLIEAVAELEKQVAAQQAAATETIAELYAEPAAEHEATAMAPNKTSAAIEVKGDWFVNFSSYNQRSAAENWVKKLSPLAGKAVVVPSNKDGKTFYRVRIVGLADRSQAQNVADQLQSDHNLPSLWVGTE